MQSPPPGQPPGYGYNNQYGAPNNAPLAGAPTGGATSKTALGMDGNIAAAIGYPIGLLAIILFIMEKENRFARFHALQSLLYHVAALVAFIGIVIIGVILGIIGATVSSSLGALVGILLTLLYFVVVLVYFGGLIYAAIKAYQGNLFKLPFVGNMADKMVNK